ncbi:ABC transporter permease [Streptomyces sp. NPDC052301]|uniref:ABC transporter permease n=1 Tax=Streptomyces sp. NPDC052301 TaxID=3365687 RepID=UPI0037D8DE6F
MTAAALTTPAAGRPRLTRWVLRLHRPTLYAWAGLVIVLAALQLALHGPLADAAAEGWRQFDACTHPMKCAYDQPAILRYKTCYSYTTLTLNALPFLVAGWTGAALVGRELESGTARLAWTQSTSPARWLAIRLAVPAVALAAGTGLLFWLHRLAWSAGVDRIDTAPRWYDLTTFHANGPTTVALPLAGLAAGTLAGLLLRRTLPALVLGTVITLGVAGLAAELMPYLWPTVTTVGNLKTGAPGSGVIVEQGLVSSTGAHLPIPHCGSTAACGAAYSKAVGYFNTYHPESHYWPLQLTTSALILAVAGLLVLGSFLVLRRMTGAARPTGKATA